MCGCPFGDIECWPLHVEELAMLPFGRANFWPRFVEAARWQGTASSSAASHYVLTVNGNMLQRSACVDANHLRWRQGRVVVDTLAATHPEAQLQATVALNGWVSLKSCSSLGIQTLLGLAY